MDEEQLMLVPKERTVSLTAFRRSSSIGLHICAMWSTLSIAWKTHTVIIYQMVEDNLSVAVFAESFCVA